MTTLNRILHAASATEEDRVPLTYAATLARAAGAELVSVHAAESGDEGGTILDANTCLADAGQPTGLRHERRFHSCCDDPIDTLLDAVKELKPDLIVMGTHTPGPLSRFVFDSHAEAIAANTAIPTLVIPLESVADAKEAVFRLERAVVPAADPRAAVAAIKALGWLAQATGATKGELLCVGVGTAPSAELEPPPGWTKSSLEDTGSVVDAIARMSASADLIVMGTHGRDSLMDTLFGTKTERLLHKAPRPLLTIPLQKK
jgi:nucleotide-binding universal stress UspA family protein